jgi:FkbM family methyltransferase
MIQERSLTPSRSRPWYYLRSAWRLSTAVRLSPTLLKLVAAGRSEVATPVAFRRSSVRFLVRSRLDVWILKEVCLDRDYERVGEPVRNGWTVLDVGAGFGAFALDVAARCPASTVYAIEPSPDPYSRLVRGIELNGLRNVRPLRLAIGAHSGAARLDVSATESALHHLTDEGQSDGATVEVPQRTLRGLLEDLGIERCDLLKLDCEGAEYDALLASDGRTLARIDRICLEYHDGTAHVHQEIVDVLTRAGFAITLTPGSAYREIGFLFARRPTPASGP